MTPIEEYEKLSEAFENEVKELSDRIAQLCNGENSAVAAVALGNMLAEMLLLTDEHDDGGLRQVIVLALRDDEQPSEIH